MLMLIDNYDSFTWNLAHRLGELGADVRVVRNDALSVEDLCASGASHVVVSPGPGRPESAGISVEAIRVLAGRVPLLGVCLGHQALATAFGGRVVRAPAPVHGKTSTIEHDGRHLFAGLGSTLEVGRYHSLVIAPDAVPAGFSVVATAPADGCIMAVRHESWPVFGVQFHPESVLTPSGHVLLRNFLEVR